MCVCVCVCVWYLCLVLVSGSWSLHRMSFEAFFPLHIFWNSLWSRILYNVWYNSPMKPPGHWLLLGGFFFFFNCRFSFIIDICLVHIFCFLADSVFGDSTFLEIYAFLLDCPLTYNCNSLWWFFAFLWVSCSISFWLVPTPFYSRWVWLKAYQLCLSFQKTSSSLIDLFCVFF